MTAMMTTMKMKAKAVVAAAWRQHSGGSGGCAAVAAAWQRGGTARWQ
jgi:hypothetical protein